MLKNILVIGAGKSATSLIDYLIGAIPALDWQVTVADADLLLAQEKVGGAAGAVAVKLDVLEDAERAGLVQAADIVISLLPPSLHVLVARDCIQHGKHLLTASYLDENMRSMEEDIKKKGLVFMAEMGLDPGIDHMSAMQILDGLKAEGATVISFLSHCGGLVAPESDNNPWHYKISWNPRNVVMAGKAGAVYRDHGQLVTMPYDQLFAGEQLVTVPGLGPLAWYPNRDSIGYIPLYGLEHSETFIRTTLRYPEFCRGWNNIIRLGITEDASQYDTEGMTLQTFYYRYLQKFGGVKAVGETYGDFFMTQLAALGLNDNHTYINHGYCRPLDVLQFAMEKKLGLQDNDRDMVVMVHEIDYVKDGYHYRNTSSLLVKGDNSRHTAMAKTVGLPLGIATKLIAAGDFAKPGLHVPVIPAIYEPVLTELREYGIRFTETVSR